MTIEVVATDRAAAPKGPYSQGAIGRGPYLFVAGQLPIDPATGELVEGTFEAQARAALRNLVAVITAAGAAVENTVRVGVYLKSLEMAPRLTDSYSEVFTGPLPARTTIEAKVPFGAEIEIDAIVALDDRRV